MKNKTRSGNLDLARRIRAAGILIHIDEDDAESAHGLPEGLLIYQVGGLIESKAFEFSGGTEYILYLTITSNLPELAISAFELCLPWNAEIRMLEDPFETDGSSIYQFGGKYLPEFEKRWVLNHFADVRRTIPRGHSLKGCLLGISAEPIPDQYRHGTMIPGLVYAVDQFGRKYQKAVELWADRGQTLRPSTRKKRKRDSLFDHPDPKIEHAPMKENDCEAKKQGQSTSSAQCKSGPTRKKS